MKERGKGDYQDMLDSITKLKILHWLSIHPYSYETLRRKTRIQRNRLRLILDNFVDKKMIIRHKYNPVTPQLFPDYYEITENKGLTFYILNLDSKLTLKLLRDIKLDTFVKDYFKINMLFPNYLRIRVSKMNRWERYFDRDRHLENVNNNKIKAYLNTIQNMDPSFSPYLYLPPNKKEDYLEERKKYSILARLMENEPSKFAEYVPKIRKFESFFQFLSALEDVPADTKELEEMMKKSKNKNFRRYDVLIESSWYFQSRALYIEIWNRLKELQL